jgi:zona occludens toxin (predicted ATPase)
MINVTIGKPGDGKTITTMEFHILPALLEGRHVYHNIPGLNPYKIAGYLRKKDPLMTAFKVQNLLHDYSWPSEIWFDDGKELSEEELGEYYLSEIPKAPEFSLIVLDEAQKKCYINSKDWGKPKNIKFAEYLSLHRKRMHEVMLITQVEENVDGSCTNLKGELIFLKRKDFLGIFGRNKVAEKHFAPDQTLRQEPVSKITRKYNKLIFDLYKSYTVDVSSSKKEIRNTTTIFKNVWVWLPLLLGVLIVSLSIPGFLKRMGFIKTPKTPQYYIGEFEDYYCGDKLYVLRPDGNTVVFSKSGVPLIVCPRKDYTHSLHSKETQK